MASICFSTMCATFMIVLGPLDQTRTQRSWTTMQALEAWASHGWTSARVATTGIRAPVVSTVKLV